LQELPVRLCCASPLIYKENAATDWFLLRSG